LYSKEVVGMFRNGKIGSKLGVGESEKGKLRILRSDQASQASPISVEGMDQENVCEGFRKDIGTAMLEAEYKKAKTLMAFQNNRRFC
jgi:hypothetical protein